MRSRHIKIYSLPVADCNAGLRIWAKERRNQTNDSRNRQRRDWHNLFWRFFCHYKCENGIVTLLFKEMLSEPYACLGMEHRDFVEGLEMGAHGWVGYDNTARTDVFRVVKTVEKTSLGKYWHRAKWKEPKLETLSLAITECPLLPLPLKTPLDKLAVLCASTAGVGTSE